MHVLPSPKTEVKRFLRCFTPQGATGAPEGGALFKYLFLESASEAREGMSERFIQKGPDIVIQGGPLFSHPGPGCGAWRPSFRRYADFCCRVSGRSLSTTSEGLKALTVFGVPMMYRMILEHDRLDSYDLSSLPLLLRRRCPAERGGRAMAQEVWPFPILLRAMGQRGSIRPRLLTPMGEAMVPGSTGRITPLSDGSAPCTPRHAGTGSPGEPGELLVSSEHMVRAYWNKPEETATALLKWQDDSGTGRAISFGSMSIGICFYLDRSVDTIKHKGYRVASWDRSRPAGTSGGHRLLCGGHTPDEKVGERIKAFVVLKQDVRRGQRL